MVKWCVLVLVLVVSSNALSMQKHRDPTDGEKAEQVALANNEANKGIYCDRARTTDACTKLAPQKNWVHDVWQAWMDQHQEKIDHTGEDGHENANKGDRQKLALMEPPKLFRCVWDGEADACVRPELQYDSMFLSDQGLGQDELDFDPDDSNLEDIQEEIQLTPYILLTKDTLWRACVPNYKDPSKGLHCQEFKLEQDARDWVYKRTGAHLSINYPMPEGIFPADNVMEGLRSDVHPGGMARGSPLIK